MSLFGRQRQSICMLLLCTCFSLLIVLTLQQTAPFISDSHTIYLIATNCALTKLELQSYNVNFEQSIACNSTSTQQTQILQDSYLKISNQGHPVYILPFQQDNFLQFQQLQTNLLSNNLNLYTNLIGSNSTLQNAIDFKNNSASYLIRHDLAMYTNMHSSVVGLTFPVRLYLYPVTNRHANSVHIVRDMETLQYLIATYAYEDEPYKIEELTKSNSTSTFSVSFIAFQGKVLKFNECYRQAERELHTIARPYKRHYRSCKQSPHWNRVIERLEVIIRGIQFHGIGTLDYILANKAKQLFVKDISLGVGFGLARNSYNLAEFVWLWHRAMKSAIL